MRFIPTGVGNTNCKRNKSKHNSVHPHRRGEHMNEVDDLLIRDGSSPQAWGTLIKPC